jgi:large subunit ribosomal protein L21
MPRVTLIPLHRSGYACPSRLDPRASEGGNVFAIIQAGGRQVKVTPGSLVTIDRIAAEVGKEITYDQVLFLEKDGGEMLAGAPFVANAKVVGVVDGETRGPKIRVFKKRRRKGFRKTRGHRSTYTVIRVTDITA